MHEMFQAIEHNDIKKAAAIQRQFIPKVNALFSYPSPAPVKAVLNYMGFEAGPTRLPLVASASRRSEAHYQGCSRWGLPCNQRDHYGSSSSGLLMS